jgi:hypothetical protein
MADAGSKADAGQQSGVVFQFEKRFLTSFEMTAIIGKKGRDFGLEPEIAHNHLGICHSE